MAALEQAQENIQLAQQLINQMSGQASTAAANLNSISGPSHILTQNVNVPQPVTDAIKAKEPNTNIAVRDYANAASAEAKGTQYLAKIDAQIAGVFDDIDEAKDALNDDLEGINDQIAAIIAVDLDDLAVDPGPVRSYINTMLSTVPPMITALVNAANPILVSQGVQDQIWNQARDRENRELQRVRDGLVNDFGARGFGVPAGPLFKQTEMAERITVEKNTSINRDVAIKAIDVEIGNARLKAELAVRANEAAVNASTILYQAAIKGEIDISQYIFEAARAILSAREAAVRALSAALDAKSKIYTLTPEMRVKAFSAYADLARACGQLTALRVDAVQANAAIGRSVADLEAGNADRVLRATLETIANKVRNTERKLKVDTDNIDRKLRVNIANYEGDGKTHDRRASGKIKAVETFKDIAASAFSALNTLTSISVTEESESE